MKRKIWLLITALCLIGLGVAGILLHRGYLLPVWIKWESKEIVCEEDGMPDKIILQNRRVTVLQDGDLVWQSENGVWVQDVLWEDIDHDSEKELMLLCWKRGRYGSSRPFWVTEDEQTWSQHIFLYDWQEGEIRPIWMASDLGLEVENWSFHERNRLLLTDRTGETSAWDWITWGLSHVKPTTLTFAAVGDNLIHRPIYEYALRHFGGNFDDLFTCMQEELDQYDVTSINQETIYVEERADYSDYPRFGTPIEVGEAVVNAGFSVVSCATNHALDQGVEAIDRTVDFYREADVICAGIQHSEDGTYRPYEILERNGICCAVFSYTQFTNGLPVPEETPYVLHTLDDEQQVRQDLKAGREKADLCIVYVHWGTEYAETTDESQKYWAKVFADCGADVVIGTHPHVLQPVEWVTGVNGNETLVYYSLGNYISAQTDPACTIGGLAYFTAMKENGKCRIADYGLKKLVTQHENGHYFTKLLEE